MGIPRAVVRISSLLYHSKLMVVTSAALTVFVIFKLDVLTSSEPIKDTLQSDSKGVVRTVVTNSRDIDNDMLNSIYAERRNNLLRSCSEVNGHKYATDLEHVVREHFVVDRRNKILFCGIEKVGCTFWKRLFQITSGVTNKSNPFEIPANSAHGYSLETLKNLPFDEILEMVNSYTKLIFVREPYSRLLSAYVDKIFSANIIVQDVKKRIAKFVGRMDDSDCAPDISFKEFFSYVLHTLKTRQGINGHFVPMYDHCRPCALRYDVIGKMETFRPDLDYLLTAHNLKSVVEVNATGESIDRDAIKAAFRVLYRYRENIEKCTPLIKPLKLEWRKLQIRGILEKKFNFPKRFTDDHVPTFDEITSEAIKLSRLSDPVKRKGNKQEVLIEAFQSISGEDLTEYRNIFLPDFALFGYDIEPKDIFYENVKPSTFKYFII